MNGQVYFWMCLLSMLIRTLRNVPCVVQRGLIAHARSWILTANNNLVNYTSFITSKDMFFSFFLSFHAVTEQDDVAYWPNEIWLVSIFQYTRTPMLSHADLINSSVQLFDQHFDQRVNASVSFKRNCSRGSFPFWFSHKINSS